MELRNLLLTAVALLGAANESPAAMRDYLLDERTAYTIAISIDAPTTCVFPGVITAVEAVNLSTKPEAAPPVLLAHRPGANYFTVRALQPEAQATANVIFDGRVYALRFITGREADRTVNFRLKRIRGNPDLWRALLCQAKALGRAATRDPRQAPAVASAATGIVTAYRDFRATVERVYRFEAEDALVFRVRLENPGPTAVMYDPDGLAVRLDREIYPAGVAEASGLIPAHGSAFAWFVVASASADEPSGLPADAPFNVIIPRAT